VLFFYFVPDTTRDYDICKYDTYKGGNNVTN
jgi:hypothetical protein